VELAATSSRLLLALALPALGLLQPEVSSGRSSGLDGHHDTGPASSVGEATGGDESVYILGGTDTGPLRWGSVVALIDGGFYFRCTAVMVGPRLALTAAHCLGEVLDSPWPLGIASQSDVRNPWSSDFRWSTVRAIRLLDPERDPLTDWTVDVAMLHLEGAFPRPFYAVYREPGVLTVGSPVVLVGYGSTDDDAPEASFGIRREGPAFVMTDDFQLPPNQAERLVAFGGATSACPGDSGGPVMVETEEGWYVAAIAIRSLCAAETTAAAVYTAPIASRLDEMAVSLTGQPLPREGAGPLDQSMLHPRFLPLAAFADDRQ
jgi:hypothetical protein